MKDLFKKYSIELDESEIQLFTNFLALFREKNSQVNLSAIRDEPGIIEKHFIDSLMLHAFLEFEPWSNVLDLWTGWWFPLVPLAIVNQNVSFTWLDSVGKKLKAIDDFASTLWLTNISTLHTRAEESWQNSAYRGNFDYVVSRATAFLPVLLEYSIPLLKVWGIFIAYKLADKEEMLRSKKALSRLGAKILKVKNYEIWDQKRVFIFIEKIATTHKKYPRKVWIPIQNPIV